MLSYEHAPGADRSDGGTVVVLLHGRGSHQGDLQGLRPGLPESWTLVTPQAPFPGQAWGYGPGWAWYRYLGEDRVDHEALEQSLAELDTFLDALPEIVGYAPGSVLLGGFSQGGTTSLAYALSRPDRIAGALNFSGFLAHGLELPAGEARSAIPPLFWAHGVHDPNIPFTTARSGRTRLREAGLIPVEHDYPIGHWIVAEEVEAAVDFMRGVAGGR